MAWCWGPSGNSLTTIEMKVFCCCHKTDRTLSCRDYFCPANSHSKFVGKDPQIVLRNTSAENLQFPVTGSCNRSFVRCYILKLKSILTKLIFQCFLFKNVLKIPTTLQNRNYYFIPFNNKKKQTQTTQKHKNMKNKISDC